MLHVENLTKIFDGRAVVDAFGLQVERGEIVALLGPSGCGKTTTLRCVAGLESPTSGLIRISDIVAYSSDSNVSLSPERRRVGMVFQSYAIWPQFTVARNVGYGLKLQGISAGEIEARVGRILEVVGLAGYGGRYPSSLSGGEQQRVALARSLVTEPAVLLMDEPLSNLDLKLREHMRGELRRILKSLGVTAIYVTHDQADAMVLADRVVVMYGGRICESGTPQSVYDHPRSAFGAQFVGASNLFEAKALGATAGKVQGVLSDGTVLATDVEVSGEEPKWTHLMIRPERVEIENEPPADEVNVLAGKLEEAVFLGNVTMCRVACDGRSVLVQTVTAPAAVGSRVFVRFPPEHVHPIFEA